MEKRSKDKPWKLKTPAGTSEYTMHVEEKDDKEVLVLSLIHISEPTRPY